MPLTVPNSWKSWRASQRMPIRELSPILTEPLSSGDLICYNIQEHATDSDAFHHHHQRRSIQGHPPADRPWHCCQPLGGSYQGRFLPCSDGCWFPLRSPEHQGERPGRRSLTPFVRDQQLGGLCPPLSAGAMGAVLKTHNYPNLQSVTEGS